MGKVRVLIDAENNIYEDRDLYNASIVVGGNTQIAYTRHRVFVNPETQAEIPLGKEPNNGAYMDVTEEIRSSILGKLVDAMIDNKLSKVDPSTPRMYTVTAEDPDNEGQTISVDLPWRKLDDDQKIEALAQLDAEILAKFETIKNA